ncbi:MAG TPA: hypothetical protein VM390_05775, partial [Acidimicrobiales bacterium]|nr:hypothetical protein [Acidimicrobiales bacterium]
PCPIPVRPAPIGPPIGPGGPVADAALPAGAVRDGVVYVRAPSGVPPFVGDAGIVLREAA